MRLSQIVSSSLQAQFPIVSLMGSSRHCNTSVSTWNGHESTRGELGRIGKQYAHNPVKRTTGLDKMVRAETGDQAGRGCADNQMVELADMAGDSIDDIVALLPKREETDTGNKEAQLVENSSYFFPRLGDDMANGITRRADHLAPGTSKGFHPGAGRAIDGENILVIDDGLIVDGVFTSKLDEQVFVGQRADEDRNNQENAGEEFPAESIHLSICWA